MRRIYFSTEGFSGIQYIRVYEGDNPDGSFTFLQDYAFIPDKDYVDVDSDKYYFKISFIIAGKETSQSDAVYSEDIGNMIFIVSKDLGDTNREDPAFDDDEYVRKIKTAVRRYKGTESLSNLQESDYDVICKLVMMSCCYNLAYDNAKYSKITLPDGISLNKGERVDHYLAIIKALKSELSDLISDFQEDVNDFDVINTTRQSYFKSPVRKLR